MSKTGSVNWDKMKKDYEDGLYDLAELAGEYSVSETTVKRTAAKQQWKRPETDRTVRRLKTHRVLMLEAICSSTMEGLRKADDLLAECESLRDVELHSKTVKNYRDICIGRSPEQIFDSAETAKPPVAELQAELLNLSEEDIRAILAEQ